VGTKERLSASVDPELILAARRAVQEGSAESVSAWVNEALRRMALEDERHRAFDVFLSEFEADNGAITDHDIAAAERWAAERVIRVHPPSAQSVSA
jgi:Arc/MetJ-type ribon-helix-helix transcriptional regulator